MQHADEVIGCRDIRWHLWFDRPHGAKYDPSAGETVSSSPHLLQGGDIHTLGLGGIPKLWGRIPRRNSPWAGCEKCNSSYYYLAPLGRGHPRSAIVTVKAHVHVETSVVSALIHAVISVSRHNADRHACTNIMTDRLLSPKKRVRRELSWWGQWGVAYPHAWIGK